MSVVSSATRFQGEVIFLNAKIQLNKTANHNSEGELKSVKPRTLLVFPALSWGGIHFVVFLVDLEGFVISGVSQLPKTTSHRLIHVWCLIIQRYGAEIETERLTKCSAVHRLSQLVWTGAQINSKELLSFCCRLGRVVTWAALLLMCSFIKVFTVCAEIYVCIICLCLFKQTLIPH